MAVYGYGFFDTDTAMDALNTVRRLNSTDQMISWLAKEIRTYLSFDEAPQTATDLIDEEVEALVELYGSLDVAKERLGLAQRESTVSLAPDRREAALMMFASVGMVYCLNKSIRLPTDVGLSRSDLSSDLAALAAEALTTLLGDEDVLARWPEIEDGWDTELFRSQISGYASDLLSV